MSRGLAAGGGWVGVGWILFHLQPASIYKKQASCHQCFAGVFGVCWW